MDTTESALDPIVLNGWPSCTDCIAWSIDGELAVAVGEFVHILIPKQTQESGAEPVPGPVGLSQWHSARIRTNVFTQREWPTQDPAPSHEFSLGEEQSLSTVVGLAWSPSGVGRHRRSVLAVLTSNHVLSFWESTRTVGEWRRVLVVNHALGDYFGWVDEAGKNLYREKRRIRAFAWSLPYRTVLADDGTALSSRWGAQYLAVANDDEVVTFLAVAKSRSRGKVGWIVKVITHVDLPAASSDANASFMGSLFQKAMERKYPISNLSWSALEDRSSESLIHVVRRHRTSMIRVQASVGLGGKGSADTLEDNLELKAVHFRDSEQSNGHHDLQNHYIPTNAELSKRIEEALLEFDSNHSLDGNSIVRKWGFASSDTHDAACITIHPSDMVEYATASLEKCTLQFAPRARLAECAPPLKTTVSSPTDVLSNVTNWILSAADKFALDLALDRYLLGIAVTNAACLNDPEMRQKAQSALGRLWETSESPLDPDGLQIDEQVADHSLSGSDIEKCLICGAVILFDGENSARARCETGHQYSIFL